MIHWYWLIVALIVCGCLGLMLMAVLVAGRDGR